MPKKNDSDVPIRAEAMNYITAGRQPIPIHHINRVRTLVKNKCCNYSTGKCVFLDEGEEHACPQVSAENICCEWFSDALLPLDAVLKAEIFNNGGKSISVILKKCAVCGKTLTSNANKAKYCPTCAKSIKAKQKLVYKHRIKGEK